MTRIPPSKRLSQMAGELSSRTDAEVAAEVPLGEGLVFLPESLAEPAYAGPAEERLIASDLPEGVLDVPGGQPPAYISKTSCSRTSVRFRISRQSSERKGSSVSRTWGRFTGRAPSAVRSRRTL